MGVNLKELFDRKEIRLQDLSHKIIAVDTFNMLYQFLTTIRTSDGQLLTDHQGNVTSHIIGLFSRTCAFLEKQIKPIFVFDGIPPPLKFEERHRRKAAKEAAAQKYAEAVQTEDIQAMKKFGARTAKLDKAMIEDAKKLITLLGLPIVQAPSEGEAQCAHIVKSGHAWAVASQDYDSLLHGTPRLVQNLSVSGRRKVRGVLGMNIVPPLFINLKENLEKHTITQDQLIAIALLVGTDYNYRGVHGIGPKKALKLVQEKKTLPELFLAAKWETHFEIPWQELFSVIKNIPVTNQYNISFNEIDTKELSSFLVDQHDFDPERVKKTLENISLIKKDMNQKSLGTYLS